MIHKPTHRETKQNQESHLSKVFVILGAVLYIYIQSFCVSMDNYMYYSYFF